MSDSLWIKDGFLLTMNSRNECIAHSVIHVESGKIKAIGTLDSLKIPEGARVVDASGCIVLPGLVNGHTHVPMSLLRGVADDLPLKRWLEERIFPLEQNWGSESFVYDGTQLSALEMIRSGTTTFNDMYYFEHLVAQAAHDCGLRAICGQTIAENSGVESTEGWKKSLDEFIDKVGSLDGIYPAVAPHSVYGVSEEMWLKLADYAEEKGVRLHFHLSEVEDEVQECLRVHGDTPVRYLKRLGVFQKSRVIAAHVTCVDAEEISLLGAEGVGMVHNIESNLKLGGRIAPLVELRQAGVAVAIGTDGVASNNDLDLLREIDTVAKLQSHRLGPGALTTLDALKLLTIEGARALGLDQEIGSIEVGKCADLIAIDTMRPHLTPAYQPYSLLVYSASGSDVRHSIVKGRVLMEDFELQGIDEKAILQRAQAWAAKIGPTLPADVSPRLWGEIGSPSR